MTDTQKVKTGEWFEKFFYNNYGHLVSEVRCSYCDKPAITTGDYDDPCLTWHCPRCGAFMTNEDYIPYGGFVEIKLEDLSSPLEDKGKVTE